MKTLIETLNEQKMVKDTFIVNKINQGYLEISGDLITKMRRNGKTDEEIEKSLEKTGQST